MENNIHPVLECLGLKDATEYKSITVQDLIKFYDDLVKPMLKMINTLDGRTVGSIRLGAF